MAQLLTITKNLKFLWEANEMNRGSLKRYKAALEAEKLSVKLAWVLTEEERKEKRTR